MKQLIFVLQILVILIVGGSGAVLAQTPDEPEPQDAAVPVFQVGGSPPVFDLTQPESTGGVEMTVQAAANVLPAGFVPAQTPSSFYWPFAVNTTGQIVNYPDSAWARNLLNITACPSKATRPNFSDPYCYAGNQGTELKLPAVGEPVYAARSGVISEVRNICTHTGIVASQPTNCPGGGSLSWEFGNFVKMTHEDGSHSYYTHLTKDSMLLPSQTQIEVGTQIATVGNTGNIGQPTLYFEVRNQTDIWMDPFGSDLWVTSNGAIVAAPDAFTGDPDTRIASLIDDNSLYVREGSPNAEPKLQTKSSTMFQLAGDRMGLLDTGNTLYIKEGNLTAGWNPVTPAEGKIVAFQMAGDRLATMDENNKFYVKYGALDSNWVLESGAILSFQVTDTRLGVIDAGGELYVKDNTGWQLLREDASAFQLNGDRVGVLLPNGEFYVKEGSLTAGWVLQASDVKSFEMDGTRIAYIDTLNRLYAKAGAITNPYSLILTSVVDVQMDGDQIVALQRDHSLRTQKGAISNSWVLESNTIIAFKLFGDRIAALDTNLGLYVKDNGAYVFLRQGVVDFDLGNRKTKMVSIPSASNQMALIAPLGTVPNSHGHPIYEWTSVRGARYYHLYIAPKDDVFNPKFYRAIPVIAFCDNEKCSVDVTELSALAWLTEDTYELYIKPGNGEWFNVNSPLRFTIDETAPAPPTLGTTANTNTLQPTVTWTLNGTAVNSAWYEVYVAPTNDVGNPVLFTWIQREVACANRDGVNCQVKIDENLVNGQQYEIYIHSWGPGGFSVGGNVPTADGWVNGQFTINQ